MTQLIAKKIGRGETAEIPSIVHGSLILMLVLGILGALILTLLSPWLVYGKLSIPDALHNETLSSFYILAASIPIVIITTGLRGFLEAKHRFDIINIVRAPAGAMTYLGPLIVLPYSDTLPSVVLALVVARLISNLAYIGVILYIYPELFRKSSIKIEQLKKLLSFGGWMTLSNIAGPLLLYLGRIALAFIVTVEAVAYFATPYDVVINLLLIPITFVTVLFPMFAEKFHNDNRFVADLYWRSMRYIFLIMLPLSVITYLVAEPALGFWISDEFAANSHRVAEILAIGIFINSFGYISQALVQAYGRPDLTAKLHVVELIVYFPYMWWLIEKWGIEGAAIAWVVRVTLSTIALTILAKKCINGHIQEKYGI